MVLCALVETKNSKYNTAVVKGDREAGMSSGKGLDMKPSQPFYVIAMASVISSRMSFFQLFLLPAALCCCSYV